MGGHEVIEHTADVGIRATGATLEEAFRESALGLLEITGTLRPGEPGDRIDIDIGDAPDLAALLVDWLSEVLYHQDAPDNLVVDVQVERVEADRVRGHLIVHARGDESAEGTPVKAVTYHQLVVEQRDGVWTTQVFLDI